MEKNEQKHIQNITGNGNYAIQFYQLANDRTRSQNIYIYIFGEYDIAYLNGDGRI